MSQVQSATVVGTDPGLPNDRQYVTKEVIRQGEGDKVTVDAFEDGDEGTNEIVVLEVNCDGRASASPQRDGSVLLTASGSGVTEYLKLELDQSDPDNWSVTVNTSGGSSYTFKKGSGMETAADVPFEQRSLFS